jgi:hypothetical protein
MSQIKRVSAFIADEWFLAIAAATSAAFLFRGDVLAGHLSGQAGLAAQFVWLFAAAFGCCLAVVRHADHLAIRLGEPYGTLILTLAITTIEVVSISALLVHGAHDTPLVRDTIFAVIMILLNGMVGLSLLIGGWRHLEQHFNLLGANTYFGVIIPLTVFSLILPNYTMTTPGPTLLAAQEVQKRLPVCRCSIRQRGQSDKSFLVLFFKKELLPHPSYNRHLRFRPAAPQYAVMLRVAFRMTTSASTSASFRVTGPWSTLGGISTTTIGVPALSQDVPTEC